jgi:uncharacterized protein (DUF305 family)
MQRKTLVAMALAVPTLGAVLAGCGGSGHDMGPTASSAASAPAGQQAGHNQADVAFAQGMIPHHAQAIDMAKLVPGRTTNPKVVDLAGRIQRAQDPEIQLMSGWLTSWRAAPTSAPRMPGMSGEHAMPGMATDHAMPGMGGDHAMPGMMTDADMAALRAANGDEFDRMWLRMMIAHHQGAIDMARTELAQGASADAKALAQRIIDGQQAEITEMRGLLGQS